MTHAVCRQVRPPSPDLLQRGGYRTALIGKWHLGHHTQSHQPNAHGFDEFYGLLQPNDAEQPLYRDTMAIDEPVEQGSLTRRFTEEAISFIQNNARSGRSSSSCPTAHRISPWSPLRTLQGLPGAGAYGDVVQELDWSVGEVLNAVQRNGLADHTLIIFTSDNGPFPEGSTGGLRGGKGTSWDGGYRVPFIARWPSRIRAGNIAHVMAMNIDLLPTFTAIARVSPPRTTHLDGKNILPIMLGKTNASPHKVLYFFNNERIAALRTQNWKMVVQASYRDVQRRLPDHDVLLLFDMRWDPQERYSMAAHRPDKWQELQEFLLRGQQELESLAAHPD